MERRRRQYGALKVGAWGRGGGRPGLASNSAAASALRADVRAVRLGGTRSCKTSAVASGGCGGSARSSPAGSSRILRWRGSCDSPRWLLDMPNLGNGGGLAPAIVATVRVVGRGPPRWRDTAGWPATATSDGPPGHTLRCNSAKGDDRVERAAHSLSTGSGVGGSMPRKLAQAANQDTLKAGPRESLLPKVKPRREASTSCRGVLMRRGLLSAARWIKSSVPLHPTIGHGPATCPTRHPPSPQWPRSTHRGPGPLKVPKWSPHPLPPTGLF